jgi:hypothetical protein
MCLVGEIVLEFSRASMLGVLRRRALVLALLSFSVVSLLWFLYWIGYDIVVWSKPLLKVNAVNYAGAVLSLAVISAGFRLRPKKRVGTLNSGQDEEHKTVLERVGVEEEAHVVEQGGEEEQPSLLRGSEEEESSLMQEKPNLSALKETLGLETSEETEVGKLNLDTLKNRAADLKRQVEKLKQQLETIG